MKISDKIGFMFTNIVWSELGGHWSQWCHTSHNSHKAGMVTRAKGESKTTSK